ncbi:Na+/H+ antiporter [Sphingosinicellaceae bacterium]|nr:Na+/H+ antiporter [Sphingosinicellaceae bacterium]
MTATPDLLPGLTIGAALVAITALADAGSGRLRLPHSILLVIVGVAISLIPGVPTVSIDPDVVLLLMLPPLLYSAGVGMSWRGFRDNLRPILLLAIGCVLFTAVVVAAVAHYLFGMSWAVGLVLGAVVSPPDAIAPMAIARRLNMPERLLTILEGEGLVNDATALILFSFAVAAVVAGGVSVTAALGSFAMIVGGELVWGLAIGWAMLRVRRWARNPQAEIMLALLTPYFAFWLPHALGGSGVLAAVAAGLYTSWTGPRLIAPATRLQGYFVWGLTTHGIEGILFLLTGMQAHTVIAGLAGGGWVRLAEAGVVISLLVIVVRFIWVFPATYLPRVLFASIRRREPHPPWGYPFVVGFTGIRGVVSLAAALSIPVTVGGAPFQERGLILFVTFCVIIVTLVGQGSLLPWVIIRLGLNNAGEKEAADAKAREVQARIAGVEAVLAELDNCERLGAPSGAVASLRQRHETRLAEYRGTADDTIDGSPVAEDANVQARLINAERRAVAGAYARDAITDDARRRIERELDLEDARNRHALESATGDRMADPESETESG